MAPRNEYVRTSDDALRIPQTLAKAGFGADNCRSTASL